ncbi:MAG: tetratricopeptide repeat protein [Acidobacteria bacterium]|nr:tetratricopeptide repeat protein [Acidobacteriota bacterium]
MTYYFNPGKSYLYYKAGIEIALLLGKDELIASAYYSLSAAYSGQFKIDDAMSALRESQIYYQRASKYAEVAKTLADQASLYLYISDNLKAKEYALKTLTYLKSNYVNSNLLEDYGTAIALSILAHLCSLNGEYYRALEYYQKSFAILQKLDEGNMRHDLSMTEILSGLGRIHYQVGNNAEALVFFEKANSMASKTLRKDRLAGVLNDIGALYLEQEDYDRALEYFRRSLSVYMELKLSHETARLEYNLGLTYFRMGNIDQALRMFLSSKHLGENGKFLDIILCRRRRFKQHI